MRAKLGNKTAGPSWPDPFAIFNPILWTNKCIWPSNLAEPMCWCGLILTTLKIKTPETYDMYWSSIKKRNFYMICFTSSGMVIDNLRPKQNVSHFAGDIFKFFFINENFCILMQIWLFASVNWVNIGPDNGLSPIRRQAIIWTNAWLL